jgi:predicted dehydrogenase
VVSSPEIDAVNVDDAVSCIGRFKIGAHANVEAKRFASGRKNHITVEINDSNGSLSFDFEDMNRLKFFDRSLPADQQGFRDIIVTEPNGVHPYAGQWWRRGTSSATSTLLCIPWRILSTRASRANRCSPRSKMDWPTSA